MVDDVFSFRYTNKHVILEWERDDEALDGDWAIPKAGWRSSSRYAMRLSGEIFGRSILDGSMGKFGRWP